MMDALSLYTSMVTTAAIFCLFACLLIPSRGMRRHSPKRSRVPALGGDWRVHQEPQVDDPQLQEELWKMRGW